MYEPSGIYKNGFQFSNVLFVLSPSHPRTICRPLLGKHSRSCSLLTQTTSLGRREVFSLCRDLGPLLLQVEP